MPNKPQRPIPDDFAEVALTMTQDVIRARYNVGAAPMLRWVHAMPEEWRAARKEFFRQKQAELLKRVQSSGAAVTKARNSIPMPEGFPEAAATMTRVQVAWHFKLSTSTVHRLVKLFTPEQMQAVKAGEQERRIAAAAKGGAKAAATYRQRAAAERRAPSARAKTPGKRSGVNWGFNKPTDIAPAPGGYAAQAAQHLRRYYVPVYRGDILSKALKGLYVVGKMALDEADMIDLARKRGWNPDAWRVAA